MLLTIHDTNLQKVAFVDNSKQNTLNYYGDTWTRSLQTGSSTFEFTVFKKAIKSDTPTQKAYSYLNERAWVSFKYHGKSFLFNVMQVEEDEQTIKCYCENLNLELINELANPYKATKSMTFVEYCNEFGILNYSHLSIGINEVSDKKLTLEWSGQDTKLSRLLSLANRFDAEIEFDTRLNADSTIKKFCINVYHENDDDHQGVGRIRNDIHLKYGNNITSITRKIDKTGIFNLIRPTGKRTVKNEGKEDTEEVVTIQGLNDDWKKYNKDGICEFYQIGAYLVAPISMQLYPSTFTNSTGELDQYTRKDFSYDTDDPKELRRLAYNELKKHCYPAITYEVDGFVDVEIGDTVKIHDAGFNPLLVVQARVTEQKISFSNPASNKTVFSNFKAFENQLSDGIQEALERLFEQSKPYTIKLSTSNGIIFKNNSGETIITPTLYKGGKLISAGVTWRWSLNDTITTGMTYTVRGQDITNTVTLTIGAYISNDRVAVDQISLVNVSDGRIGAPGKSTHMHFAFSEKPDGSDLSLIDNGQRYYGYYTDEQESGSTDKTMYKWFDRWGKIKSDREDIEKILDTKADQALTQEQLNALNEKAGIIQAEVEARASVDEVNNLIRVYNDFVNANETARAQAEKDLISASQRVSNIAKDLGELSDRWNFIDTYMSSSNEGLVIGKNDGSSSMMFNPNGRISMYSAGVEVMYISQGVIHIENGIFSKTIQIGRFREEQYHINPDMNVIRYVG